MCLLALPSLQFYLVTLAIRRTSLRAQRGYTSCSSPTLLAVALQCRGIAAAMTTAGSGAQGEGVGCVEAQEVVIGIAEEVKQHLEKEHYINRHKVNPAIVGMLEILLLCINWLPCQILLQ